MAEHPTWCPFIRLGGSAAGQVDRPEVTSEDCDPRRTEASSGSVNVMTVLSTTASAVNDSVGPEPARGDCDSRPYLPRRFTVTSFWMPSSTPCSSRSVAASDR
eukprot:EG_transcript_44609